MNEFDYIIVGAGSAGCVLAARLSEDPKVSVAVLEAGGDDSSLFIRMPTALSIPMNMPKYNWGFESQPEPGLDGRRMDCPRGKVIGGSSSINGMAFVRGHACDIDQWEEAGATGWNYENCLPYYKRMESWYHGENRYRGGDGPVGVNAGNDMRLNPLYQAFIDSVARGALNLELSVVLSNKPDAFGLVRATQAGIATVCIEHGHYSDRDTFDRAMASTLDEWRPDLLVLAGFMRILSAGFVERYTGKILNIHPALLPASLVRRI